MTDPDLAVLEAVAQFARDLPHVDADTAWARLARLTPAQRAEVERAVADMAAPAPDRGMNMAAGDGFRADPAVLNEIVPRTHDPRLGDVEEAVGGPLTPEQRKKVDYDLAILFDASDRIGLDGLSIPAGRSTEEQMRAARRKRAVGAPGV